MGELTIFITWLPKSVNQKIELDMVYPASIKKVEFLSLDKFVASSFF